MDNEVIEDDDVINLESFDDEDDAPLGFRDKNHPIHVEDEEDQDEDDYNDASGGAMVHMMILISIFFITNEAWVLKLNSCLLETSKLICHLDVMNLFVICHLDVNVMTNELIYLVLLKVYYVKDDCFVMLLC